MTEKRTPTAGEQIAAAVAIYVRGLKQGQTLEQYLLSEMARSIDKALTKGASVEGKT